jgi:hypothetical protein
MTNQDAETYIRLRWQSMSDWQKRDEAEKLHAHDALAAVCDDLDRRRDWKGYAALMRSQPRGMP